MVQLKKKKKFFDAETPLIGKTMQIRAYEIEELDGRYIKFDLTRLLRGKGAELQLKVKVEGDKIIATPTKISLMPYYMKRIVRKGTNYVEDSFSTECKNAKIRIKPFLITRRKVSRAVRKALRVECKKELIEYSKNETSDQIFDDIIKNRLQKNISSKLKKIYPLSACEIRVLSVEKEIAE